MTVNLNSSKTLICIDDGVCLWLTIGEAMELLDVLPGLIAEMAGAMVAPETKPESKP